MTLAYACLLIAIFLPYFYTGYAKFAGPGFTNKDARPFLEALEGKRKRAYWAHLNQFESFAPFAIGVLLAHQRHAPQHLIDGLAAGFIVFRIAYFFFYLADKCSLRSLVWLGGFLCVLGLFVISF